MAVTARIVDYTARRLRSTDAGGRPEPALAISDDGSTVASQVSIGSTAASLRQWPTGSQIRFCVRMASDTSASSARWRRIAYGNGLRVYVFDALGNC